MTCNCTPENHRSDWGKDNGWEWDTEEHVECWRDHEWHCETCAGSGHEWASSPCGCCSHEVACDDCGGSGIKTEQA